MYDLVVWCVALLVSMVLGLLGLNKLANIVDFEGRQLNEVDFTHRMNEYSHHELALNVAFALFHVLVGPWWYAVLLTPVALHSALSMWAGDWKLDITQSYRALPSLRKLAYGRLASYGFAFVVALLAYVGHF